jgi:hypothetical protein
MVWLKLSLYADDATVFVNPIKAYVDLVMQIMHHFGEATGLRINVHKSTVEPIRCSQVDLSQVLQNFSGAQVQFPITYLGLPLCLGRLHMVHLQLIFDRAATRLTGWQGKLMNIGVQGDGQDRAWCFAYISAHYRQATEEVLQCHGQAWKEILVDWEPRTVWWQMQGKLASSISTLEVWWTWHL